MAGGRQMVEAGGMSDEKRFHEAPAPTVAIEETDVQSIV
jgi:hypothetical protein